MLHPILKAKIEYPEHALIYSAKMKISYPSVLGELKSVIRSIRNTYRSNHKDRYAEKWESYPNTGDWLRAKRTELGYMDMLIDECVGEVRYE